MADKRLMIVVAVLLVGSITSARHYMESRTPAERLETSGATGTAVGVVQEVPEMLPEVTREPVQEDLGRAFRFRIENESVPTALAAEKGAASGQDTGSPRQSFRYSRKVRGMKPFLRTDPTPGS